MGFVSIDLQKYLGTIVRIVIDRPLGSAHPAILG